MDSKFLKNVSRRTFLKGTVATSAAVALAGCSTDDEALIFPETAGTVVESVVYPEETFKGVCRPNCWSSCQMDVTVRNNKVVRTKRARMGQNETGVAGLNEEGYYDRICLRGLSHVQRMYRPERILYPMKRVEGSVRGDRNGFARISWAEAIELLSSKMSSIIASEGDDPRAFAIFPVSNSYGEVTGGGPLQRLAGTMGLTAFSPTLDMAMPVGLERVFGAAKFPFFSSSELADMVNANTIFAWGTNITETQIQNWHFMADALDPRKRKKIRAGGKAPANLKDKATLITVDPMYTVVAAKSDYYVAPRVGSDTAIALGMLREIMWEHENEWIDWDYLFEDTVAPFLVKPDGTFLREADITGAAAATGYVMWNKTDSDYEFTNIPTPQHLFGVGGTPPRHEDSYRTIPADPNFTVSDAEMLLEVSVTLNGASTPIICKPAYLLLKESAAEWTLTKAAEYSSLSEDVIRTMANLYGDPANHPVFSYTGYGPDHYTNGHHFYHALASVACVTGNVGKPGASCGQFVPFGFAQSPVPFPVDNPSTAIPYAYVADAMENNSWGGAAYPNIKGMWVAGGNPVSNMVDQKSYFIERILDKLEFIVTSEVTMTDTCAYSDLILPACYWFESIDMVAKSNHLFFLLNEKAIEPIGSSISDWEITKRVAYALDEKMNANYSLNFAYTEEEYLKLRVDNSPMNTALPGVNPNISWDRLKEMKSLRYLSNLAGDGPYIHGEDKIYRGNNTVRAEFYSESPFVLGLPSDWTKERIPVWENPTEAWDGDGANAALIAEYPLAYQQEHQRWKVHSQWFDAEWMDELAGEPSAYIHPTDAANYGSIVTGDTIKVSNARGFATVKAILTEKMPIGQISIPKGIQRYQFTAGGEDSGCFQELTTTALHPATNNMAFYDVRVKIEKV